MEPYNKGSISEAVYAAYNDYKLDYSHELDFPDPNDSVDHRQPRRCKSLWPNVVDEHIEPLLLLSGRGNLGKTLPPLALVNRQILLELWTRYLTREPGLLAMVAGFNFRPLFRFCRMMRTICFQTFTARNVHIGLTFSAGPCNNDYSNLCVAFANHWLGGFPLWHPVRSSHSSSEPPSDSSSEWSLDSSSNPSSNPEPDMNQECLLKHWMYFVRQAAALYRIDDVFWATITRPFLQVFSDIFGDRELHDPSGEGTPILIVKDALWMISEAAKYRMGYSGEWTDDKAYDYNGEYLLGSDDARTASQKEYTLVEIVEGYRQAVDRALREKLGHCYDEWEQMSEDATVPDEGVI